MTFRPYIPQLFTAYDVYLYVDADIRFLSAQAFEIYFGIALRVPQSIVIAQEVDACYCFMWNPKVANSVQEDRYERMASTFGLVTAESLRYVYQYNAGIFAMHRDSPVWRRYRNNLELVVKQSYNRLSEQDALNVVLFELDREVMTVPATLNWLCAAAFPIRDGSGQWVRPYYPYLPIDVLHFVNSGEPAIVNGRDATGADQYAEHGLPVY